MYKNNLTKRQYAILKFIHRAVQDKGRPPTLREIGEQFSISSPKGVSDHLEALQKKGWIDREKGRARGIQLIKNRVNQLFKENEQIPLVGKVAAGEPTLAVENIEGVLNLEKVFSNRGDLFALRVKGDSMIEAGITQGDILIAREQSRADVGDIVVAIVNGEEGTVKKLVKSDEEIHLEPANPEYETIIKPAGEVEIRGRVVGVIRKV